MKIGVTFRMLVSANVHLSLVGTVIVFLLLVSKNICDFLYFYFNVKISFCIVIVVVAISIFPLLILKSPEDFW